MNFSSQVKDIRQKCYLSQEMFAKELGVSFATINRLESGKTKPSYKTLKSIANFCQKNNIAFEYKDNNQI